MNKLTSLSELAEALGKYAHVKAWEKGGKSRLYFNDMGYNTKKMETKAWIELRDGRAEAVVTISCPSQPSSWIESQQKEIKGHMKRYVRYIRLFYDFGVTSQPIDVILNNALLDAEEVTGYYTEWREVRVAINSFGKLALRNRRFIVPFKGTKNTAPRTFVPCGPEGWIWLQKQGEFMLDTDEPLPDADERARLYAKWEKDEIEHKAIAQQALKDKEAEEQAAIAVSRKNYMKFVGEGMSPVQAWKQVGCPQPAPPAIIEAKIASGMTWYDFKASI